MVRYVRKITQDLNRITICILTCKAHIKYILGPNAENINLLGSHNDIYFCKLEHGRIST